MIRSMTGYGRSEMPCNNKTLIVEIKSLNHRNLEVSCRIPNGFGSLEIIIKKKIGSQVFRGRVEVNLRFENDPNQSEGNTLQVNLPLIREYYSILSRIREELNLDAPVTLELVSSIRNGIYAAEPELDDEESWPLIEKGVEMALSALMDMKEKEGALLYNDFKTRIDLLEKHRSFLESRAPQVVLEYRKRLSERVKELAADVEIDQGRLSQETALMAEKTDITEELVRLGSHISQFKDLLDSPEPAGRQLDFIVQEMHREINTIGSKSSDLDIARVVIEVKTELAKLREQAQNIE